MYRGEYSMDSIETVLFNWLSIKMVADARPEDEAAKETVEMFEQILQEDFLIEQNKITFDERFIKVEVETKRQENFSFQFPKDYCEILLNQLEKNPKYVNPCN